MVINRKIKHYWNRIPRLQMECNYQLDVQLCKTKLPHKKKPQIPICKPGERFRLLSASGYDKD